MEDPIFKAWNLDEQYMLNEHDLFDISVCRLYATGEGFKYRSNLIPLQYTGKTDITGCKIFAGDVIIQRYATQRKWGTCVVVYIDSAFRFVMTKPGVPGIILLDHNFDLNGWEVIGSVFEHPHLCGSFDLKKFFNTKKKNFFNKEKGNFTENKYLHHGKEEQCKGTQGGIKRFRIIKPTEEQWKQFRETGKFPINEEQKSQQWQDITRTGGFVPSGFVEGCEDNGNRIVIQIKPKHLKRSTDASGS